jgi:hypothetical protein
MFSSIVKLAVFATQGPILVSGFFDDLSSLATCNADGAIAAATPLGDLGVLKNWDEQKVALSVAGAIGVTDAKITLLCSDDTEGGLICEDEGWAIDGDLNCGKAGVISAFASLLLLL